MGCLHSIERRNVPPVALKIVLGVVYRNEARIVLKPFVVTHKGTYGLFVLARGRLVYMLRLL